MTDIPDPPLHNLLICNGPVCVVGCPVNTWAHEHGMTNTGPVPYEPLETTVMTDKPDTVRRCSECGGTTIRFDPPIAIEPQEACGEMKPGTYTGYERGGIPVCMKPRGHINHPEDADHGYLVEYWDKWPS